MNINISEREVMELAISKLRSKNRELIEENNSLRTQERLYILGVVDKMIKREHLSGNGQDKTAERNGVISVYNKLISLDVEAKK